MPPTYPVNDSNGRQAARTLASPAMGLTSPPQSNLGRARLCPSWHPFRAPN